MVDYIKIILKGYSINKLLENDLLSFVYKGLNPDTGELLTHNRNGKKITPCRHAYYGTLEFKIYDATKLHPEGLVTLTGSLHKYFNRGSQNYNDFTANDMRDVLKELKQKFNLDLENSIIQGIEIGLNITPTMPTTEILQNCLLHKTMPFDAQYFGGRGEYLQASHSDYYIKLYNKGLQNIKRGLIKRGTEIMRFEIKYSKMRKVNAKGIFNLNDLIHFNMLEFKDDILKEWRNILFYDYTIEHKTENLKNYNNPNYWKGLLKRSSKSAFNNHRAKLRGLIKNHSEDIQGKIGLLITEKIEELNTKGCTNTPSMYMVKMNTPLYNKQCGRNRRCRVTGIDIRMQGERSFLLGPKGLRYYCKNEHRIFEQVKRKYLSKKWTNEPLEKQIEELYHNIRNHYSNGKVKQARLYNHQQINFLECIDYDIEVYSPLV
ncbi:hypothetical protein [Sediminicola arcticus]|uniref:Uncharacterized protein n=1 Tax=Sediminicola arcticus TaxID=1574308 RepID=A0ABV2SWF8_9FLAO